MKLDFYPFSDVRYLSKRDVQFVTEPEKFSSFISQSFHLESFGEKIKQREAFPIDRKLLATVVKEQYQKAGVIDLPMSSIEKLEHDNTYTVITAHQPSLLTGPLYFIYKILSVINLAEKLDTHYSDQNILPVFIIGSEDHDFEEINHLSLFGKQITWESNQGGPVGRMSTETLDPVLEQVYEILGSSENAAKLKSILQKAFHDVADYNTAVFRLVHELFKKYNIVIVVTDDQKLKAAFKPHIHKEIFESPSQDLILETQSRLQALDLKSQAHARDINFFYLTDGRRDRIIREGDNFVINDTALSFTPAELEEEIENHPERFSPNVVMRPIYQESILPNLAYLGGGGEIAYWTERKTQFEHFGVSFPILIRRNSLMWIGSGEAKLLSKYGISETQLFDEEEDWVRDYVKSQAKADLEFSQEIEHFNKAYELLAEKAGHIDRSLENAIKATQTKQLKNFEQLSSRLLRAEKDRHDRDISKIRKLHSKLFPGGGLQERKDNFISFYLKYGDSYFDTLKDHLDPFNASFVVISETA